MLYDYVLEFGDGRKPVRIAADRDPKPRNPNHLLFATEMVKAWQKGEQLPHESDWFRLAFAKYVRDGKGTLSIQFSPRNKLRR